MIPQALKDRTQWLVWRLESKPGAKKPAKMPYYCNGERRTGKQGSDADRRALTTFDYAMQTMSAQRYNGVGFAFLPDDGLLGIDLDNAYERLLDEGSGEVRRGDLQPRMREIVQACQSFTEFSPSGFGLHIYAFGKTQSFKSNDVGVEVFCGAQFFTVTGDQLLGTPDAVNDLSPPALALLSGIVEQAKEQRKAQTPAGAPMPSPKPRAQANAVTSLDNDFVKVNAAALANFDAWVPALFPAAKRHAGGYRVPQKSLGRDLQEDLSIHVDGIVDYGVHDQGDARQGKRTPIDLVIEWGAQKTPKDALHWLAGRLGLDVAKRESKGSRRASSSGGAPPEDGAPPGANDEPPDDSMPVIRWRDGELPQIVDAAEAALLKRTSDEVYQRMGFLVRVVRKEVFSVRNYKRPPGVLGTMVVQPPYLTELFTRSAYWERWDARKNDWRRTNAPKDVASTYLARSGQWRVPVLWSTVSAPTLRPDGSLMQQPGYDPGMRAFYDPNGVEFPRVPDKPTRGQAMQALAEIAKAISTFPFVSGVDRAVALAMALTAVVRRSLPSAPLFAITAPSPESGKTLLGDFGAIMAMGTVAPSMKYPETDEEFEKLVTAVLMEGDQVIMIDNVERVLQSDLLCQMLTSESIKGRVLGLSQSVNLATNCMKVTTGNHLAIGGDLRFRTVLCRLDAQMEHPGQRVFKHDFREWAVHHRPTLVAAALTAMRAYLTSGFPGDELCPQWGRFEHWTEMVRRPLMWLGEQDPCASLSGLEGDDPERQEHLRILHEWFQVTQDKQLTARELLAIVLDSSPGDPVSKFRELITDIAADRQGVLKPKRLSHWLRRHAGRRVAGYQLVKLPDNNDHTAVWKVEKVGETDN